MDAEEEKEKNPVIILAQNNNKLFPTWFFYSAGDFFTNLFLPPLTKWVLPVRVAICHFFTPLSFFSIFLNHYWITFSCFIFQSYCFPARRNAQRQRQNKTVRYKHQLKFFFLLLFLFRKSGEEVKRINYYLPLWPDTPSSSGSSSGSATERKNQLVAFSSKFMVQFNTVGDQPLKTGSDHPE